MCGDPITSQDTCERAASELSGNWTNATKIHAELAPQGCFTTQEGLYFNSVGSLLSSFKFAKSLCRLKEVTSGTAFRLPIPDTLTIDACGTRRSVRTYDIPASDLEAAIGLVGSGSALRVKSGTAVLSKTQNIGVDLVILGQPWEGGSEPLTLLDLNLHQIQVHVMRASNVDATSMHRLCNVHQHPRSMQPMHRVTTYMQHAHAHISEALTPPGLTCTTS